MKRGDKIYLVVNYRITTCKIVEFYSSFTELEVDGKSIIAPKFRKRLFYGYGYRDGKRYLFLKKLWHYYPATLIEKIITKFEM